MLYALLALSYLVITGEIKRLELVARSHGQESQAVR